MKILITGANGYIGCNLTKCLLDLGHEVVACDIRNEHVDSRASFIEYNILEPKEDDNAFEILKRPDVCIHLAWRDGFMHNSKRHLLDLSSHYRFLTNLIDNGLQQLVVMGTMHEIGYHEGVIDENTPCNPMSNYGIAKDCLRRSLFQYIKDQHCILQWTRGFYIYGDDLNNHSIFTKILEKAKSGEKVFPFNSGKNKYDFIKVSDLVLQIAAVATQQEITGIINCCSGSPVSLSDKVNEFINEHHLNMSLDYGAFPDRPYDSPCIYGDSRKIKQIFQIHNLITL